MIAMFLMLADVTPPSLTVGPGVFADERVTAPVPRLAWPDAAQVRVEDAGDELIVRFDQPIAPDRIAAFRDIAGAAIGDLRWNDDSLVLRAAPGWTMRWAQAGSVVTLAFVAPPAPPAPAAATTDDGTDRTAIDSTLALVEADAAAGYTGQARRRVTALAARYPDDRQVARMVADVRAIDGDVRGAAVGYRALGANDRAARRVIAAAPGIASIGVVARDGSDMAQVEGGVRIDAAVGDRFAVGGGLRQIASRIDTPGGTARPSTTVVDGALAATLTTTVRLQLLASSSLDDGVTGGGARLTAGSSDAQVRAVLLRHMPDYPTPAQALAGGYVSRAGFGGTYRLTPGLVGQADVGLNRYGLAGRRGASDTVVVSGGLDYLIRRQFPALGLSYRFEAEYIRQLQLAANGEAVVPLVDRENHTVQGLVSGAVGDLQITGQAGWTVDRFGGDGPTASLGLAAPIGVLWRVEGSGGVTSISRPGFTGRQLFARAQVSRSLGRAE
ncbi:hypothetical protein ASE75_04435 [Sphingomonas sp. Leaf17]|uniref:hypothetical protein n=1 Tax=Sphingomonas sp. Leaf17 TaxID=1735683 RepID=UPI0006F81BB9|nr:hypothetical protein [Sphingomonas sp. Leaf17]KQM65516.1 hypothetical protein ASE75_04435 [Sphingomonas sp. Leaf17]